MLRQSAAVPFSRGQVGTTPGRRDSVQIHPRSPDSDNPPADLLSTSAPSSPLPSDNGDGGRETRGGVILGVWGGKE